MSTPAEKLAAEWYDKNITFRGDHTGGMYLSVRDWLDVVLWALGDVPSDSAERYSREAAISKLTPVAQKYLNQEGEKSVDPS